MENQTVPASNIQNSQRLLFGQGKFGQGNSRSQISAISQVLANSDDLKERLQAIVSHYEIFRSSFELDDLDTLSQIIHPKQDITVDTHDWRQLLQQQLETQKQRIFQTDTSAITLTVAQLNEQSSWLHLAMPTMNTDLFSLTHVMGLLLKATRQEVSALPQDAIQYQELAPWLDGFLLDDELADSRAFWHKNQNISPYADKLGLANYLSADASGYEQAVFSLEQLWPAISKMAAKADATTADVVASSLRAILNQPNDHQVHLCRVLDSRNDPALADAFGPLSRVLPIYPQTASTPLDAAKAEAAAVNLGQGFAECFVRPYQQQENSFEFVFSAIKPTETIEAIHWHGEAAKIHFTLIEQGDNSRLVVNFDRQYISTNAINLLFNRFEQQLGLEPVETPCIEQTRVQHSHQHVLQMLSDNGKVISPDNSEMAITQLTEKANQLARYLCSRGIGKGDLVALHLESGADFVVAMLGVVKAGAAYIPIDSQLPNARINTMLEESKARLMLTAQGLELDAEQVTFADIDFATLPKTEPNVAVSADDLAYVLYTSGSTGKPKGVAISHRALANHMQWMINTFEFDRSDVFLQRTPVGFDASVWELWAPLLCGSTLVTVPNTINYDMAAMAKLLVSAQVTILQMVPGQLEVLLADEQMTQSSQANDLRLLFCGGEALKTALARTAVDAFDCELVNLYGPSECCIDTTFWHFNPRLKTDYVPIGQPIDNVAVKVIKTDGEPAKPGEIGWLCVTGDCLFDGYYRQKPLGEAYYDTGDLVRVLADGQLMFLQRTDDQVKINGYRIEPGEIEAQLSDCEAVQSAVVVAHQTSQGQPKLVAYLVGKAQEVCFATLKQTLLQRLPRYMVPDTYLQLDSLPLGINGKVDRKALPGLDEIETQAAYVPARTDVERTLVDIWARLLKLDADTISTGADFFDLGGHSLLAIRMMSEIRDLLQIELSVDQLFNLTTVAGLAAVIEVRLSKQKLRNQTVVAEGVL